MDEVPLKWRATLADALAEKSVRILDDFIAGEEAAGKPVYPPRGSRLRALELTAPDAVKVVILGQDPYHGEGQAHGLAFSVPDGIAVPPSLINVFKELESDLGLPRPPHGNLEHWAREGVLLLNTVLTVEHGRAGSHRKRGWEPITDAVVRAVASHGVPCVFMLWGKHACASAARISGLDQALHLVLTAPHPSPLSAHSGFLGCRHFSQANAFLATRGRGAIDWRLPGQSQILLP